MTRREAGFLFWVKLGPLFMIAPWPVVPFRWHRITRDGSERQPGGYSGAFIPMT
jgi:hypothetical protein